MIPPYFWLGADADFDKDVIDALEPLVPLVVVDSTEVDE